jgi:hypothetical protein
LPAKNKYKYKLKIVVVVVLGTVEIVDKWGFCDKIHKKPCGKISKNSWVNCG